MRRIIGVAVVLVIASVVGCGGDKFAPMSSEHATVKQDGMKDKDKVARGPEAKKEAAGQLGGEKDKEEPVARKIVYTGNISLVVEDFTKAEEKLHALLD